MATLRELIDQVVLMLFSMVAGGLVRIMSTKEVRTRMFWYHNMPRLVDGTWHPRSLVILKAPSEEFLASLKQGIPIVVQLECFMKELLNSPDLTLGQRNMPVLAHYVSLALDSMRWFPGIRVKSQQCRNSIDLAARCEATQVLEIAWCMVLRVIVIVQLEFEAAKCSDRRLHAQVLRIIPNVFIEVIRIYRVFLVTVQVGRVFASAVDRDHKELVFGVFGKDHGEE